MDKGSPKDIDLEVFLCLIKPWLNCASFLFAANKITVYKTCYVLRINVPPALGARISIILEISTLLQTSVKSLCKNDFVVMLYCPVPFIKRRENIMWGQDVFLEYKEAGRQVTWLRGRAVQRSLNCPRNHYKDGQKIEFRAIFFLLAKMLL